MSVGPDTDTVHILVMYLLPVVHLQKTVINMPVLCTNEMSGMVESRSGRKLQMYVPVY